MTLNILYLGNNYGTSRHRADALRRLGHRVELVDPWAFVPRRAFSEKIIRKLCYEIGAAWMEPYIRLRLLRALRGKDYDVIWSDQSTIIGPTTTLLLKQQGKLLVTYIIDDPFGPRDKRRFSLFRKTIKYFDLVAVVRQPNVDEAYDWGAKKVILVSRSADEIAHARIDLSSQEKSRWESQVAFIGTWMPERGSFISRLISLGVPLVIYGNRWEKAPERRAIKTVWKGPGLIGKDYVKAIQCAKVCIGLVSKGNRDLHTQRSVEIPYIGGLLCAERTSEHLTMYKEDEEAVFWSSPEECAQKCFELLADEKKRKRIAEAGHARCVASGYLNEPTMKRILGALPDMKVGSAANSYGFRQG